MLDLSVRRTTKIPVRSMSHFFDRREPLLDQQIAVLCLGQRKIGREVVATEPSVFIVEMYMPGEIVEARRPFIVETAADALRAAKGWINDSRHNAINFRVVDPDGTIMFDARVVDLN